MRKGGGKSEAKREVANGKREGGKGEGGKEEKTEGEVES
jgi:hypothetical protein